MRLNTHRVVWEVLFSFFFFFSFFILLFSCFDDQLNPNVHNCLLHLYTHYVRHQVKILVFGNYQTCPVVLFPLIHESWSAHSTGVLFINNPLFIFCFFLLFLRYWLWKEVKFVKNKILSGVFNRVFTKRSQTNYNWSCAVLFLCEQEMVFFWQLL